MNSKDTGSYTSEHYQSAQIASSESLDYVQAIRKRPAMYVGSTALFGFINYLVCPVSFLLAHGAKRIHATVNDAFEVCSDAPIQVERTDAGRIAPFQEIQQSRTGRSFEATVLNALSQQLRVSVRTDKCIEDWQFTEGVLISNCSAKTSTGDLGTVLHFKPDNTLFNVTAVSQDVFASYFRRLSYLHAGVRFSFEAGGSAREYYAPTGISELFAAISAPYQLMHEPIHITASEGNLALEVVLAYQSWKDNHLWCFINKGRAAEGGTHEQGLVLALNRLKRKLSLPEKFANGVVAVASIDYPQAFLEGCIKARIGNPELKSMISRLVVNGVAQWMDDRPATLDQIRQLETFQIPEAWSFVTS